MIIFTEWAESLEKEMEASLFLKELNQLNFRLEGGSLATVSFIEGNTLFFTSKISLGIPPKILKEVFLEKMLVANLFGQGTFDACLGLSEDSTYLTLQKVKAFESYEEFKEELEDFIHATLFWQKFN